MAKDLVRVEVAGVLYALEVERIREIVNPLPIIELPHEQPSVLGVADYRDEVAVIVDLRSLFGRPPAEAGRRAKWIILSSSGVTVGVVVDAVVDVFSSAANPKREVPFLDARQRERGITSAYRFDDRLVFLLDADRLVQPALELPRDAFSFLPAEGP